jgi:hypothetical protein
MHRSNCLLQFGKEAWFSIRLNCSISVVVVVFSAIAWSRLHTPFIVTCSCRGKKSRSSYIKKKHDMQWQKKITRRKRNQGRKLEARTETRTHQGLVRSQRSGRRRLAPPPPVAEPAAAAPSVAAGPGSATDGRRSSLCWETTGGRKHEAIQGQGNRQIR